MDASLRRAAEQVQPIGMPICDISPALARIGFLTGAFQCTNVQLPSELCLHIVSGKAGRCMLWGLQEMRRPAPDAPPSKRPRTECKDGAGSSFSELGRFDYRVAEQLAQGAQGFIVTCGFQRCSTPAPAPALGLCCMT